MAECISRNEPRVRECAHASDRDRNGFKIYRPITHLQYNDDKLKIRIYYIGKPNDRPTKTVLLTGETGSGKTRLLNRLYNHICSVEYEDKYRLEIEDETGGENKEMSCSQTEYITGYLFYHELGMRFDFNILIIDTPGLNDTRGAVKRKEIMTRMEAFLKKEEIGITDLHCLGIVVKANLNRCQEDLVVIHQQLFKLFGKDTAEITQVLATHASDKTQDLGEILDKIGVERVKVFYFDNGTLFSPNTKNMTDFRGRPIKESRIRIDSMMWTETKEEYDDMFDMLALLPSVSLKLTRKALRRKAYLELVKENLIRELKSALASSLINQNTIDLLTDYENSIDTDNNQLVEVFKLVKTEVPVEKARWFHFFSHAHNCTTCYKTCFAVCTKWIICRSGSFRCLTCKCPAKDHVKSKMLIKEEWIKVDVSREEMKQKHGDEVKRQAEIRKREEKRAEYTMNIARLLIQISYQAEWLSEICRVPCHQSLEDVAEEIKNDLLNELSPALVENYFSPFMSSALEKAKAIETATDKEAEKQKLDQYLDNSEMTMAIANLEID